MKPTTAEPGNPEGNNNFEANFPKLKTKWWIFFDVENLCIFKSGGWKSCGKTNYFGERLLGIIEDIGQLRTNGNCRVALPNPSNSQILTQLLQFNQNCHNNSFQSISYYFKQHFAKNEYF